MNTSLQDLKKEYAKELSAKAAGIQTCIDEVVRTLEKNGNPDWKQLEFLTHKLAGSSGTYGYQHISSLARYLEDIISDRRIDELDPNSAVAHLRRWHSAFVEQIHIALVGSEPQTPIVDLLEPLLLHFRERCAA